MRRVISSGKKDKAKKKEWEREEPEYSKRTPDSAKRGWEEGKYKAQVNWEINFSYFNLLILKLIKNLW